MSEHENNLDNSPDTPDEDNLENQEEKKDLTDKKFSVLEPIKGIAFAVIATVIFLGFPEVITYVFKGETYVRFIPTFDADVIRSLWIPIILWCLFRIGIEVFGLIERRYTKRLATVTIIGNILATICGLIIFLIPRAASHSCGFMHSKFLIVNCEYYDFIHRNFNDMSEVFSKPITGILDKPNLIILFAMIFFFILESLLVLRKSKRDKNKDEDETGEETDEESTEDVDNQI